MALAAVAHALDRLREPTLALLARSEWLRAALRSRASRVELFAATGVATALAAALLAPALLWLWAPLLLGVPHLVADVRYLALPRQSPAVLRVRDVLVAALLAATLLWPSPRLGGAAVVMAWLLSPAAPSLRGRWVLGSVLVAGMYAAMWSFPIESSYVLVHAHNAIAVLLFAWVFGRGRARWALPLILVVISALLLSGALDAVLPSSALDEVAGYLLPLAALEQWPASWCARLAVLFVFLQSVHYAIWLRLIPELARRRDGARSFRASLAALQHDFGPLLVVLAAAALLLLLLAAHDPLLAQREYLRFAGFHAYLELAFLARWLAGPRARSASRATGAEAAPGDPR